MVKFTWRVAVPGYQWEKDEEKAEAYLKPVDWRFREYAPLEEFSGLFRFFADTKRFEANILAFANKFGNLGAESNVRDEAEDVMDYFADEKAQLEKRELLRQGAPKLLRTTDSLRRWVSAIGEMRKCVELWDKAQGGGTGERSMREVQMTINDALDSDQVRVAFEENPKLGGLALQVIPKSLLGALWVQFALAVQENKQYRRCRTCGLWFELAPEINRISKYYCTEACRSRAYRARKERARQLAAGGKTPKEIAEELDSDVKTVNGWLKNRKE